MGLFDKKATVPPSVSLETAADSRTATADSSFQTCHQLLNEYLTSNSRKEKGVVLNVYLENFKRINDIFGYQYSEDLLAEIQEYLQNSAGCPVYRSVGVEFLIILDQYSQSQAAQLAEDLLERFKQPWNIGDFDCFCSAHIGMCSYPGYASTADEMLKCLDLAVAKASEYGLNQSAMYDLEIHNEFLRHQRIALCLQSALEKKQIEVRFRPTYHSASGKFTRAEFYMRIFIEGIGMVGSAQFLPLAEDFGQIHAIEAFALDQVGHCISRLMKEGKEFESIALPISSLVLLQEDFPDQVKAVIEKYQIPPKKLAIEIQENAFTTAFLNINVVMQELSDLGVELILNNFGTGYSKLTSLLDFPVDTVKFERMFIWQLETNPVSAGIIQKLVEMAKVLNLHTIAEGIETENQRTSLQKFGCDYQQGFYYSPTLEEDVLVEIMDTTLEASRDRLYEEKEKMR